MNLQVHAIVAVALVVAYVVVTVTGHDGNSLLLLLGGQFVAKGVDAVAKPAATPRP